MSTISTLAVNLIARTATFSKGMKESRNAVTDFQKQLKKNARDLAFQKSLDELTTRVERFKKSLNKVTDDSAFRLAMKRMGASAKKFKRVLKDVIRGTFIEKGFNKVATGASRFKSVLGKLGPALKGVAGILGGVLSFGLKLATAAFRSMIKVAKIAAVAIIGIGIASVKVATDVQETENLFKISMGSMAASADRWAKEYSKSLGLFTNDTKKSLGTFQLMLTSMGLTEKQAFKMSKQLTTLANDIASFRNQKPEEIFLKLQAGITGEAEPLKRLGILVNDSIIKQLALTDATVQARLALDRQANSIKKQALVLTDTEKVLLRYKAIVNATTLDQGDMKRTLDDTANVFRVVWAQVKVTANTIGTQLLPVVTKVAIAFRDWLTDNQGLFQKWASTAANTIQSVINRLKIYFKLAKAGRFDLIFKDLGKLFAGLLKQVVGLFTKITPVITKIGSEAGRGFFDGFMEELESSGIGRFLGGIGGIGRNIAAPFQIGGIAGRSGFRDRERKQIESRIGSITERATGKFQVDNRRDESILQELRMIRINTQENLRSF